MTAPDRNDPPAWSCGCTEDRELERMQQLMAGGMTQRKASEAVWPKDETGGNA